MDGTTDKALQTDATLKKTISDMKDPQTEVGGIIESARTGANNATEAANAAKSATEDLKKQTNHITFQVNSEDGGLDIVYTE